MNKVYKNKIGGFIALFSVVIISFILVLIAITLSFTSFFARFNILDTESKKRSENLAEACIEHARLLIAEDKDFMGTKDGEIYIDEEDKCYYFIDTNISEIIGTSSVYNAFTYYRATVNISEPDIPITGFEELTNYP